MSRLNTFCLNGLSGISGCASVCVCVYVYVVCSAVDAACILYAYWMVGCYFPFSSVKGHDKYEQ